MDESRTLEILKRLNRIAMILKVREMKKKDTIIDFSVYNCTLYETYIHAIVVFYIVGMKPTRMGFM